MRALYFFIRLNRHPSPPFFFLPSPFIPLHRPLSLRANTPHATGSAWSVRHRLRERLVQRRAPDVTELHSRAAVQQRTAAHVSTHTACSWLVPAAPLGSARRGAALSTPPACLVCVFPPHVPRHPPLVQQAARAPVPPPSPSPRRCCARSSPHAALPAASAQAPARAAQPCSRCCCCVTPRATPTPRMSPPVRCAALVRCHVVTRARTPATRYRPAARAPAGPRRSPMPTR